jgi:PTH1 family peptidyl-tRNA hydrolase
VLIKPTTYVNLSGRAVHYWMKKEKVPVDRLLVVVDDLALPFGILRLRPHGGDGGHNGLTHINQILGTQQYARLRFGIGNEFFPGSQVRHVLGEWTDEETVGLAGQIKVANDIILSFGAIGVERTMNLFNNR